MYRNRYIPSNKLIWAATILILMGSLALLVVVGLAYSSQLKTGELHSVTGPKWLPEFSATRNSHIAGYTLYGPSADPRPYALYEGVLVPGGIKVYKDTVTVTHAPVLYYLVLIRGVSYRGYYSKVVACPEPQEWSTIDGVTKGVACLEGPTGYLMLQRF